MPRATQSRRPRARPSRHRGAALVAPSGRALVERIVAAAGKTVKVASGQLLSDSAAALSGGPQTHDRAHHPRARPGQPLVARLPRASRARPARATSSSPSASRSRRIRTFRPTSAASTTHSSSPTSARATSGSISTSRGLPFPPGRVSPELRGRVAMNASGTASCRSSGASADGARDEVDVRLKLDDKGNAAGTFTPLARAHRAVTRRRTREGGRHRSARHAARRRPRLGSVGERRRRGALVERRIVAGLAARVGFDPGLRPGRGHGVGAARPRAAARRLPRARRGHARRHLRRPGSAGERARHRERLPVPRAPARRPRRRVASRSERSIGDSVKGDLSRRRAGERSRDSVAAAGTSTKISCSPSPPACSTRAATAISPRGRTASTTCSRPLRASPADVFAERPPHRNRRKRTRR